MTLNAGALVQEVHEAIMAKDIDIAAQSVEGIIKL